MKYIVPELLDRIKAKYEDDPSKPISMYKLVLQSGAKGFNLRFTEEESILEYDYLCVRMFDLDVTGWEVINIEESSKCIDGLNPNETIGFILVTITMYRKL